MFKVDRYEFTSADQLELLIESYAKIRNIDNPGYKTHIADDNMEEVGYQYVISDEVLNDINTVGLGEWNIYHFLNRIDVIIKFTEDDRTLESVFDIIGVLCGTNGNERVIDINYDALKSLRHWYLCEPEHEDLFGQNDTIWDEFFDWCEKNLPYSVLFMED